MCRMSSPFKALFINGSDMAFLLVFGKDTANEFPTLPLSLIKFAWEIAVLVGDELLNMTGCVELNANLPSLGFRSTVLLGHGRGCPWMSMIVSGGQGFASRISYKKR